MILLDNSTMGNDTPNHAVFEHMLEAFELTIYLGAPPSHPHVGDKLQFQIFLSQMHPMFVTTTNFQNFGLDLNE